VVDVKQRAPADRGLVGAVVDGEVAELRLAVATGDALALGLQGERDDPAVGVGDLQVVLPALVGRDEVHAERSEGDPRSFDHEPWLLIHVDTSCCGAAVGLPATC
jgi:hypothetical protein